MSKNISMVIFNINVMYGDLTGTIITYFNKSVSLDKLLDFKQKMLKLVKREDKSGLMTLFRSYNSIIVGLGDLDYNETISITHDTDIELLESITQDIVDFVNPHSEDITILTAKVNDNIKHIKKEKRRD